ncbi:hypothetical protein H9P43_000879 [Blastocladiella emersonii ATCC 22665]|nr:hypothetical protein H9P43_000879 [Blastocladiella emersonii ATCC 22665]
MLALRRHLTAGTPRSLSSWSATRPLLAPATRATAMLSHLLHGNEEVRAEVERTHSVQLAHDQSATQFQFHHLKPGTADEYVKHWTEYAARRREQSPPYSFHASFITLIGNLDTVVHITTYPSYQALETALLQEMDTADAALTRALTSSVEKRTSHVCREFAFWLPEDVEPSAHGIYELRSYLLRPGKLLEWGQEWRKGVEARRNYCTPIGAWFSQLGELNRVHHLWFYQNLEERRISRERAWELNAWANAVTRTVPLLDHLETSILRRIG